MTLEEKVRTGQRCHLDRLDSIDACRKCPYEHLNFNDCVIQLRKDTVRYLEQEEKRRKYDKT